MTFGGGVGSNTGDAVSCGEKVDDALYMVVLDSVVLEKSVLDGTVLEGLMLDGAVVDEALN